MTSSAPLEPLDTAVVPLFTAKEKLVKLAYLLSAALAVAGCASGGGSGRNAPAGAGSRTTRVPVAQPLQARADAVGVTMYVMSKCPFSVQVMELLGPLLAELGPWVDFHLEYISLEQEGQLTALHGQEELEGNILQLCAIDQLPDRRQWLPLLGCWNKSWRTIPAGWESCVQQAGLDPAPLESCAAGDKGKQLAKKSAAAVRAAGVNGSPTIVINGTSYEGLRTSPALARTFCAAMSGEKAPLCAKLPAEVEVKALVINDRRCARCDTARLEEALRTNFFARLSVEHLDYSQPQARALLEQLKIKHLPAVLLRPGAEQSESYAAIEPHLSDKGDYKQLLFPADFDPTAEICDNKIDDTGNGKIDCKDPSCQQSLLCRPDRPGRLDLFVMSQCPYGVQGLNALQEVLGAFGKALSFDLHYIVELEDGQFRSLHGQPEVDENIRQLCAKKHYPRDNKYLEYVWCRNKEISSPKWQPCAADGISAEVIARCAEGEQGKRLLAEDLKLAEALKIQGSPTWMTNNKHLFNGISARVIQQSLCQHNPQLAGCKKPLSEESTLPDGSCGQ